MLYIVHDGNEIIISFCWAKSQSIFENIVCLGDTCCWFIQHNPHSWGIIHLAFILFTMYQYGWCSATVVLDVRHWICSDDCFDQDRLSLLVGFYSRIS